MWRPNYCLDFSNTGCWHSPRRAIIKRFPPSPMASRVAEIRKLRAVVVVAHAEEKRPHLEQCRDIDAHYQPLIKDGGRADNAIKFLLGKVTDYLNRKRSAAMKEAEAKRLREEAAI